MPVYPGALRFADNPRSDLHPKIVGPNGDFRSAYACKGRVSHTSKRRLVWGTRLGAHPKDTLCQASRLLTFIRAPSY
jgi:hypothetical protein